MAAFNQLFLAGPTGVGKSAVALELARRLGGEIISVDSMQVYRGMDIGTAKPSAAERAQVRHHLIDVVDVQHSFDAAQFVRLASLALQQIQARGRIAIFCGGTGLYLQAFREGLGKAPPGSPSLRAELSKLSLSQLLEELARSDPSSFNSIDRHNRRRVERAVEVIRLSHKPYSQQRAAWNRQANLDDQSPAVLLLERDRVDLHSRIDQRVDQMFALGLVPETQNLLARGLGQNATARQALGYRQVIEFLDGARSLDQTVSLVKQKTRQYAKRQLTWFRHQLRTQSVAMAPDEPAEAAATRLLDLCQSLKIFDPTAQA